MIFQQKSEKINMIFVSLSGFKNINFWIQKKKKNKIKAAYKSA